MAAITFLMSSLARLRVSARTDRPDMAAAGAAGARTLIPRRGETRVSRAAAAAAAASPRPSPPPCARARGSARPRPPAPWGPRPQRACAPRPGRPSPAPRESLGPHSGRGCAATWSHVQCCAQGEVRGAAGGVRSLSWGFGGVTTFLLLLLQRICRRSWNWGSAPSLLTSAHAPQMNRLLQPRRISHLSSS